MDTALIKEILEKNGLNDIEEMKNQGDLVVLRFYFDFDEEEIKSANECNKEEGQDVSTYLNEVAVEHVGEVLEDIMEKANISAEFVSYEPDVEEEYNEFIGVFYNKDEDFDIDALLDELEV